jgi:hypothetical protein
MIGVILPYLARKVLTQLRAYRNKFFRTPSQFRPPSAPTVNLSAKILQEASPSDEKEHNKCPKLNPHARVTPN